MRYFIEVFHQTPFWVYLIFVSLVLLGIRARNARTVPVQMLFLSPFLFIGWSFGYLVEKYGITTERIIIWIAALIFGTFLGWFFHRRVSLKIEKSKKRITLPGTWSILFLSVMLFLSKYSFGYLHAVAPHAKEWVQIYGTDLFISGTISGAFLGKFLCFWHKYRKARK
jgi:hypothetical protein